MTTPNAPHALSSTMWLIILVLATLAHITADIYLPSLPAISQQLHSNESASQLTLSTYLFGFAISHLFYGPLSDRIGRKKPILLGIALSIIGGLFCALAPNMSTLIVGRFIQGCGVGACNTIVRSITRDLFSGNLLAKVGSQMGMMMVLVTMMAPTVGGYIEHFFSWRGTFFFLVAYTFAIWLLVWIRLPETSQQLDHTALNLRVMLKNYGALFTHKTFVGYTICMSCAYSGILVYFTQAPFLLQNIVGLTPVEFGWTSFLIGGGLFLSSFLNSRLVMDKGTSWMVLCGILSILLGSGLLILGGLLDWLNAFSILGPIMIFAFGCGLSFSNASAGALHPFTKNVGAVAAMYGFLQVLSASVMSSLTALLVFSSQLPLGVVLFVLGCVSLGSWRMLLR